MATSSTTRSTLHLHIGHSCSMHSSDTRIKANNNHEIARPHTVLRLSHSSMHGTWKMCLQGRFRTSSSSSKSSYHTISEINTVSRSFDSDLRHRTKQIGQTSTFSGFSSGSAETATSVTAIAGRTYLVICNCSSLSFETPRKILVPRLRAISTCARQ